MVGAAPRAPIRDPWPAMVPAVLLAAAFFLLPIANMVRLSLTTETGIGLGNYIAFFEQAHQADALLRSLQLATMATALSALLAWPLAFFVAFCVPARWRIVALLALLAPFWTSFTIRAFSWQLVLSDNGVLAWALREITGAPVSLGFLYTMGASVFGLAIFGMMLTTLTLYGAMTAIDRRLIEASASLGGGRWAAFRDIVFPLALPGWFVGVTLTFIICVGDYAVPTLLGGGLKPVLAQMMLSTVKGTYDLSAAATMAVLLTSVVLLAGLPIGLHALLKRRVPGRGVAA
jgi:spermidine/putrescine transport system permease protein